MSSTAANEYGDRDEVRKLSGNPPVGEVSDEYIDEQLSLANAAIDSVVGNPAWTQSDPEWRMMHLAANLYAAAQVLDTFKDVEGKAKKFNDKFDKIVLAVRTETGDMWGLTGSAAGIPGQDAQG